MAAKNIYEALVDDFVYILNPEDALHYSKDLDEVREMLYTRIEESDYFTSLGMNWGYRDLRKFLSFDIDEFMDYFALYCQDCQVFADEITWDDLVEDESKLSKAKAQIEKDVAKYWEFTLPDVFEDWGEELDRSGFFDEWIGKITKNDTETFVYDVFVKLWDKYFEIKWRDFQKLVPLYSKDIKVLSNAIEIKGGNILDKAFAALCGDAVLPA